ncbi:MAG: alanine racemase [Anaerolineae bacterium]|nr:alanine racemase [Anaerolineae bacterium]
MKSTSAFLKSLGIVQPTVVIDGPRVRRNIETMAAKARQSGVRFRPHFKTHQCAAIGNWFREAGIRAITVSSLDMARYFADHGWDDITVAIVANVLEMDKINALAAEIHLGLLVDSMPALSVLQQHLQHPIDIWIKIDVGSYRTGIRWDCSNSVITLAQQIVRDQKTRFAGLLTHSGQSYDERTHEGMQRVYDETVARMVALKHTLAGNEITPCQLSVGDTPTSSIVKEFTGVDEVRPGTFVFYDLMQRDLGACTDDQIAIVVACPVIGKYADRKQIVVYGGAVHLSKDAGTGPNGKPTFGRLAAIDHNGLGTIYHDAPVISLSQEHGIIQVPDAMLDQIDVGDLVAIVPIHCCLACDLYGTYTTLDGTILPRR